MIDEIILSRTQSEITILNRQVTKTLSLVIDIADQDGNTGVAKKVGRQ